MMRLSSAKEFIPTPNRGKWTDPPAETHSWFLQMKGIFTGAFRFCSSASKS
jgi:hypothetical protein